MPTVNETLLALNIDELSPLEALTKLHELKRLAAGERCLHDALAPFAAAAESMLPWTNDDTPIFYEVGEGERCYYPLTTSDVRVLTVRDLRAARAALR